MGGPSVASRMFRRTGRARTGDAETNETGADQSEHVHLV